MTCRQFITCSLWLLCAMPALWITSPLASTQDTNTSRSTACPTLTNDQKIVRGQFTQKKYLHDLKKPLVSHGQFVLERKRGLIWQVHDPVQTTLTITNNALIQRHDGDTVQRISRSDQPSLQVVTGLMLAIFNADCAKLKNYFEIAKEPTDTDEWWLSLVPQTNTAQKLVQQIHVRGDAQIRHIVIKRPNGDKNVIELAPRDTASPKPLSKKEKQRFSSR